MTENKELESFAAEKIKKRGTPPMQVSPIMLLKTHIEKMSVLGFAIMYMKINNL